MRWIAVLLIAAGFGALAEPAVADVLGPRTAVVILTSSGANQSRFTQQQARDEVFGAEQSASSFLAASSQNRMTIIGRDAVAGDVIGPYDVGSVNPPCNDASQFRAAADAKAAADGKSLAGYDYRIYVTWFGACSGVDGRTEGPNVVIVDNHTQAGVAKLKPTALTYYLGLALGLDEAATIDCFSGGTRVAISATCSDPSTNRDDPFDSMGATSIDFPRLYAMPRVDELGWRDPGEVRTVTQTGSFELRPITSPDGTRALTFPRPGDPGRSYWLEVRRNGGAFDDYNVGDPAIDGLQVRLDDGRRTQLLDMRPETNTFSDATLPAKQTFTDPVARVSITLNGLSEFFSLVSVDFTGSGPDTTPPEAPVVSALAGTNADVELSWSPTRDNIQTVVYGIFRDGVGIAATGEPRYVDTRVPRGRHTYEVIAYDAASNASPPSAPVTLKVRRPSGPTDDTALINATAERAFRTVTRRIRRLDRAPRSLSANVRFSIGGSVSLRIRADRRRGRLLARGSASSVAPGRRELRVRFTPAGRRAVRRGLRSRVVVTGRATTGAVAAISRLLDLGA